MENTEHPLMLPNVIFMNFWEQVDALRFKAECKMLFVESKRQKKEDEGENKENERKGKQIRIGDKRER